MKEQKKTVGAAAQELQQQELDTQDPIELQRAMQEEYIDELIACTQNNRKEYTGNFFVVVITKKEKLLSNVLRNYFFARSTCPTPDYDQAVYRYDAQKDELEYIWCLPDRQTARIFFENKQSIIPEEHQLLQHILDFHDGTLYRLAKKLNKEKIDSNIIES